MKLRITIEEVHFLFSLTAGQWLIKVVIPLYNSLEYGNKNLSETVHDRIFLNLSKKSVVPLRHYNLSCTY